MADPDNGWMDPEWYSLPTGPSQNEAGHENAIPCGGFSLMEVSYLGAEGHPL